MEAKRGPDDQVMALAIASIEMLDGGRQVTELAASLLILAGADDILAGADDEGAAEATRERLTPLLKVFQQAINQAKITNRDMAILLGFLALAMVASYDDQTEAWAAKLGIPGGMS